MRILIAEDEKKVAHFIRKALREAGHAVDEVYDGNAALKQALTTPYDAIILDVMMPGRDGLSVLRILREERTPTPVLLLTARGEVSKRIEGLNLGADDYMAKPFAIIAEPHGISIETDLPEKLHGVVDARRLEQIILNLLDNAVKYNHEKGRMKISGTEIRKGNLSISAGNTGPGIPKEHAPHLFERFFRSDATIKAPGHGLGLSLARELARAHGGDLILTRSDCEWTEFNLFIRARS